MELRYSTRSRFFAPIEEALRVQDDDLRSSLSIDLGPGGYERDALVVVSSDNRDTFETDWVSNHPTRFSARIRAAATVLRHLGMHGRFQISHRNGTLTVRRAPRQPGSARGSIHVSDDFDETPDDFREYM